MTKKKPPVPSDQQTPDNHQHDPCFAVVGIGASAGGFTAVRQMLATIPDDTGVAFVLVQHLNPTYHSNLAELLSKATRAGPRNLNRL